MNWFRVAEVILSTCQSYQGVAHAHSTTVRLRDHWHPGKLVAESYVVLIVGWKLILFSSVSVSCPVLNLCSKPYLRKTKPDSRSFLNHPFFPTPVPCIASYPYTMYDPILTALNKCQASHLLNLLSLLCTWVDRYVLYKHSDSAHAIILHIIRSYFIHRYISDISSGTSGHLESPVPSSEM